MVIQIATLMSKKISVIFIFKENYSYQIDTIQIHRTRSRGRVSSVVF